MSDQTQVSDKTFFYPGDEQNEDSLRHEDPYRRWVCIMQNDPDEYFKKRKTSSADNLKTLRKASRVFRHFDDKSIDSLLSMASIAEARMAKLSSQRVQITMVNTAICAGAFALFLNSSAGIRSISSETYAVLAPLSMLVAIAVSVAFWLMVRTIGVTEVYYFHFISDAFYAASKHYRTKPAVFAADEAYAKEMGLLRPILETHIHRVFELINFFGPICSWLAIIVLLSIK